MAHERSLKRLETVVGDDSESALGLGSSRGAWAKTGSMRQFVAVKSTTQPENL